jgi:hypothetical protein
MPRSRRVGALMVALVVLLGAMATSGCVVLPVRMKTRIEGPAGTKQELPTGPIVPGRTTRSEVEERYRAFAVETGIPDLFWGRFRKSSWAVVWAVGGYYTGAAGGGRTWGVYNVFITFDERGTVGNSVVVPDDQFQSHVTRMAAELHVPPLDFSQSLLVEGLKPDPRTRNGAVDVELRRDGVVVTKYPVWTSKRKAPPPPKVAVVPLERIERLTVGGSGSSEAVRMEVEFRFAGKTEVGKRVKFWVDPRVAPTIVRWQAQVRTQ